MTRPIQRSASDRLSVRSRTSDMKVHALFDFLVEAGERHEWRLVYYKAAHSAVQFHWADGLKSYRHSFIVNVGDLLFYLRPQALQTDPLWSEIALKVFGGSAVKIGANARHETTIRVANLQDARLIEQLFLKPIPRIPDA
jgi:hypothetical protein